MKSKFRFRFFPLFSSFPYSSHVGYSQPAVPPFDAGLAGCWLWITNRREWQAMGQVQTRFGRRRRQDLVSLLVRELTEACPPPPYPDSVTIKCRASSAIL